MNEGPLDRGIRVVLGAVLIWLGAMSGIVQGTVGTVTIVVGAIALITGLTGFCGLYKVLGINTCPTKNA